LFAWVKDKDSKKFNNTLCNKGVLKRAKGKGVIVVQNFEW